MTSYFRKTYFVSFILGSILLVASPFQAYAAPSAETQNGKTGITYECAGNGNCDFNDLIAATVKVVNWAVTFALAFSIVVIAWAGFKLMMSGGSPGERDKARKMLQSVFIGIVFVMAAWLIVNLIMTTLVKDEVPKLIKN